MNFPEGMIVIATICNTVADASPYALWFSDGGRQCVVDLSDYMHYAVGFTGIAYHDQRIYVAVQGFPSRILILDMALNVVDVISDDNFDDLHSLQFMDNALFMASPRSGKLLKTDLGTRRTSVVANFDPDAWVSVAHCGPDDILLCGHHMQFFDPQAYGGGVFSIARGRAIVDGLEMPHSLVRYRDGFVVLDSGNAQVVYFDRDGVKQTCRLDGFLRGAAVAGPDTLLVGGGPHRTISRKNPAGEASRSLRDVMHERVSLFALDQMRHTRTYSPELPGFEIYDLLVLPADAVLTPNEERVLEVGQGTFARFYYVTLVDAMYRLSLLQEALPTDK
jgi:hypothetical protein